MNLKEIMRHGQREKLVMVLCISIVAILVFLVSIQTSVPSSSLFGVKRLRLNIPESRACFEWPINTTDIQLLDDVLTSQKLLSEKGSNIFCHVTTCLKGTVQLTPRQACSIESAAKTNPHSRVFVLFASPVGFQKDPTLHTNILQALKTYDNVNWHNLNLWTYAAGTPAQDWVYRPDLFQSVYLQSHMSDILRLLSMYKYGGTHMDLDMIIRKSLADIRQNYAGFEGAQLLGSALLNFEPHGLGHVLMEEFVKEFVTTFDGTQWAQNGPLLITRVIQRLCKTELISDCPIFTAYPKSTFYAIEYPDWENFFEPEKAEGVMATVEQSMAVHIWNKMSAGRVVRLGENSAYERLAKQFCPRVYQAISEDGFF